MNTYCPYCMHPARPGEPCPFCGQQDYQPLSHQFPPGILLHERYVLGRTLGAGGFGITYLGFDTLLKRRVAVKEYFPRDFVHRDTSASLSVTCYEGAKQDFYEKGRERFLQEARVMVTLDKVPEIVQVLDFFAANNTVYIVMELLEGNTLAHLLEEQKRIPPQELFPMLQPLLRGMNQMHGAGIIHRDISPDNIMLMDDGKPKLMDFGCARDVESGTTMTVMLKHGYAPLEQYSGHDQGPWTDIYALCATYYRCLTGQRPPDAMKRLGKDPLIPPRQLQANISPKQEQALLKGLVVEAADRWESVAPLYEALYQETLPELPWPGKKPDRADPTEVLTEEPPSKAESTSAPKPEPPVKLQPKSQPKPQKAVPKGAILGGTAAVLAILIGGIYLRSAPSDLPADSSDVSGSTPADPSGSSDSSSSSDPSDSVLPWSLILGGSTFLAKDSHTIGVRTDGTVVAVGDNGEGQCNVESWDHIVAVAMSMRHTVGLREDGTVVAVGYNGDGQCNVVNWTNIAAVAASDTHTVGLRVDGTVVATGSNEEGQCNVQDWTNIVSIDVGIHHTVGLRTDGTVLATGSNSDGQCNVSDWGDIVAVGATDFYTVGCRKDGAVAATMKEIDGWTNIAALSADHTNVVGLHPDGTVVSTKNDTTSWTDITAVSAGRYHAVGLRTNGTVVSVGGNSDGQCNVDDWTDIVAVSAGSTHTVGLRADGTVVATGDNQSGQCDVDDWTNICRSSQDVQLVMPNVKDSSGGAIRLLDSP